MRESMIIIGGGIAGLSTGCYGQMNGYRTCILEMHDRPGGLCTSWTRQGYTFDGCLHWLVGSRAGSSSNRIWRELGATQGREMVDHEEFVRVEGKEGKVFVVYTDTDRLKAHMKDLAPGDAEAIDDFCRTVRRFSRLAEVMGLGPSGAADAIRTGIRMLPHLGAMRRYAKISTHEYATRFSDPFLRESFAAVFDMPDFPMLGVLMTLAWMNNKDAGYPIGGSLAFARSIEKRYLELGGQIEYESPVAEILVVDDRAVGVRLANGTERRADIVVSAADGHATIFDMLGGRYVDDKIRTYYDEWPIFRPIIQVSLGVAADLSDEPHMVSCELEEPVTIAGEARERLSAKHYCYDPTLAPPGKSVVVVMFESDYDYWQALYQEEERYDAEKKDVALKVIDRLEKRFPAIRGQVEVVDVATPMTYERYTGNWRGSMEGWMLTTKNMGTTMGRGMDQTLPGLKDFYMAGQWVEPGGGVPTAALSARKVVRRICREDGKRFVTSTPPAVPRD
jgi:phytoene dehydrogenase-like protein